MYRSQTNKIYDLLKSGDWVCVNRMAELYVVDYRRRLKDLLERGIELEGVRCTLHKHKGGQKMWRLQNPPKRQLVQFTPQGTAIIHYV